MRFYRKMYLAKDCIHEKSKLKRCIKRRKLFPDYMIIILGEHLDRLEVMHSALLAQPHYKKSDILIIGAAKSKDDAFELLTDIAGEAYRAGFGGNMCEYIKNSIIKEQKE